MKKFALILTIALLSAGMATEAAAQKTRKVQKGTATVVFTTNIHCNNCKKRIEDKLPFEKGVKDIVVDVAAKTVTIDYDKSKTSPEKLRKAISDLGYTAETAAPAKKETGVVRRE